MTFIQQKKALIFLAIFLILISTSFAVTQTRYYAPGDPRAITDSNKYSTTTPIYDINQYISPTDTRQPNWIDWLQIFNFPKNCPTGYVVNGIGAKLSCVPDQTGSSSGGDGNFTDTNFWSLLASIFPIADVNIISLPWSKITGVPDFLTHSIFPISDANLNIPNVWQAIDGNKGGGGSSDLNGYWNKAKGDENVNIAIKSAIDSNYFSDHNLSNAMYFVLNSASFRTTGGDLNIFVVDNNTSWQYLDFARIGKPSKAQFVMIWETSTSTINDLNFGYGLGFGSTLKGSFEPDTPIASSLMYLMNSGELFEYHTTVVDLDVDELPTTNSYFWLDSNSPKLGVGTINMKKAVLVLYGLPDMNNANYLQGHPASDFALVGTTGGADLNGYIDQPKFDSNFWLNLFNWLPISDDNLDVPNVWSAIDGNRSLAASTVDLNGYMKQNNFDANLAGRFPITDANLSVPNVWSAIDGNRSLALSISDLNGYMNKSKFDGNFQTAFDSNFNVVFKVQYDANATQRQSDTNKMIQQAIDRNNWGRIAGNNNWTGVQSFGVALADGNISTLSWTKLQNYPSACSAGQYVSTIGDTLTCGTPSADVNGKDIAPRLILTNNATTSGISAGDINIDGNIYTRQKTTTTAGTIYTQDPVTSFIGSNQDSCSATGNCYYLGGHPYYKIYAFKTVLATKIYSSTSYDFDVAISDDAVAVLFNWDNVTGAEGYKILRSQNGGSTYDKSCETTETDGPNLSDEDSHCSGGAGWTEWSTNVTVTPTSVQAPSTTITWGGHVFANYFHGDGSNLTNLPAPSGVPTFAGNNVWTGTNEFKNDVNVSTKLTVGTGTTSGLSNGDVNISGTIKVGSANSYQTITVNTVNSAIGDHSGIGFSGWGTVAKSSIGHIRTDSFGRGDLVFLNNNTASTANADISDEKMRITSSGIVAILGDLNVKNDANIKRDLNVGRDVNVWGKVKVEKSAVAGSTADNVGFYASITGGTIANHKDIGFQVDNYTMGANDLPYAFYARQLGSATGSIGYNWGLYLENFDANIDGALTTRGATVTGLVRGDINVGNNLYAKSGKMSSIAVGNVATSSLGTGDINVGRDLNVNGKIMINTGGSAGKVICWKTKTTLGYCSSIVGVDGSCTCN